MQVHFRSFLALAFLFAACSGGGSSPTEPSPSPMPPPPPPTGPKVLRSATFQSASGYNTAGSASIVEDEGSYRLELHDDFATDNSGALDVRLCRQSTCTAGDLDLGPIQAFRGAQTYELMDAATEYAYVVIWCRAVDLPFGYGLLQ